VERTSPKREKPPPRGSTLYEIFLITWSKVVPALAEMAWDIYPDAATAEDAVLFAWEGVFFRPLWGRDLDAEGIELVAYDVYVLEQAIREVLRAVAEEIRAGRLSFDAVHPDHHRRFDPDPALIEKLMPWDRVANRITRPDRKVMVDLRFREKPMLGANQLPLPLEPQPQPQPDATPYPTMRGAITQLITEGHRPGRGGNIQWLPFRDRVLQLCHVEDKEPGYSLDRIQHVHREIIHNRAK
jgi:hypothetical protein